MLSLLSHIGEQLERLDHPRCMFGLRLKGIVGDLVGVWGRFFVWVFFFCLEGPTVISPATIIAPNSLSLLPMPLININITMAKFSLLIDVDEGDRR